MQRGDGSWGTAKHRQGGNGKNAQPPSRAQKRAIQRDMAKLEREKVTAREQRRRLQDFVDAREWLSRKR